MLAVLVNPTIVYEAYWYGVKKMQLLSSAPARNYESSHFEHLEVLHDTKARHCKLRLELSESLSVPYVQQVKQVAPRFIAQCLEHEFFVDHDVINICD